MVKRNKDGKWNKSMNEAKITKVRNESRSTGREFFLLILRRECSPKVDERNLNRSTGKECNLI